jgi:two-component system, NarL family, response regulator DesR
MIRILLAEDQGMVRDALATLLGMEPGLQVVTTVGTADQIVPTALRVRPDLALLDVEMPGGDGLTSAARLHEELPGCRILILTTFGRPGYLRRAMDGGAAGFVLKDGPVEALVHAIHEMLARRKVIDPALAAGPNPLSGRERDVLAAAADGSTVAEVARRLHLSEGTVRNYLSAAIGKTGSRNRLEATRTATDNGWI